MVSKKMKKLYGIIIFILSIIAVHGCSNSGNNPASSVSGSGSPQGVPTQTATPTGPYWHYLGIEGFSLGSVNVPSFCINNGTPYIAYNDCLLAHKETVMKYDGNNWVNVGLPGFSAAAVDFTSLSVWNGTPYVGYMDCGNNTCNGSFTVPMTVKTFNGSSWVDFGNPDFSDGGAKFCSLVVANNIAYAAYSDYRFGEKLTVMTSNGGAWTVLGTRGISTGLCKNINICMYNGFPTVTYLDCINNNTVAVQQYNGSWISLGSPGNAADYENSIATYSNGTGKLYVAFQDVNSHQHATVEYFDGASWNGVGAPGFSDGTFSNVSVYEGVTATGMTAIPLVSFQDDSHSYKASVMGYDGTSWHYLGKPGFSNAMVYNTGVSVYQNHVCMVFEDDAIGQMASAVLLK
jgi:hypothetical protein